MIDLSRSWRLAESIQRICAGVLIGVLSLAFTAALLHLTAFLAGRLP